MTLTHTEAAPVTLDLPDTHTLILLCWNCGASLQSVSLEFHEGSYSCSKCAALTEYQDGIWQTLSPLRSAHFEQFMTEYANIRAAEGRGSTNDEYYLNLPYKDPSGRNSGQWRIRARTFDVLMQKIVTPLAKRLMRPLRILDLGAGNGWMSYRLALAGHLPVAVDLLTNPTDGLGAAIHYSASLGRMFPCVQAELDHLPFAASSFDLAIFNASFHYSEDYVRTLAEAIRCVEPGGSVAIADTPWYAKEASGQQMMIEKHSAFTARYGFPSNSVASLEFLTPERLEYLEEELGIEWNCVRPFYGLRWALRPLAARLKSRRTPSQFRIYEATVRA